MVVVVFVVSFVEIARYLSNTDNDVTEVHTVDSKGWFSCNRVIFECALCVCWQNSLCNLSERTQFLKAFLDYLLSTKHFCQKLSISVHVCQSYSKNSAWSFQHMQPHLGINITKQNLQFKKLNDWNTLSIKHSWISTTSECTAAHETESNSTWTSHWVL